MEVLILGICHEIFFFGKKRSKIRVRIIHRRALYTGKYGIQFPSVHTSSTGNSKAFSRRPNSWYEQLSKKKKIVGDDVIQSFLVLK